MSAICGRYQLATLSHAAKPTLAWTPRAWIVSLLDAGEPITALAGVHSGCYELFAHEPIRTVSDLKGKRVGIRALRSGGHLYIAMMAAHVGLDPHKDIAWVTPGPSGTAMQLFVERKVDVFLGFPPEPQELRARKIGRVILNTATDKPWSDYFCCTACGNRDFVRDHPIATKRYLRAILKAVDICAAEPERVARQLVDGGFTEQYDYALQTLTEVPYESLARVRPGGHDAFLRAAAPRGRHDQIDPAGDPRRRHRLALRQRAQTRAEGVSMASG